MADPARRVGWVALPAIAAAGIGAVLLGRRAYQPGSPYLAGAPLLIAHRGGSALAPENTLLAFERAVEWWRADILEIDVHPTRDGEAVVIHDPTLERTTDGRGLVADHTLAEIRTFDAGYRFTPDGGASHPFRGRGIGVPTLTEVLQAFPTTRVNVEVKDGRVQQSVWESILACGAEHRVLVAAAKTPDRSYFRGRPIAVSAGEEELKPFIAQLRLGAVIHAPRVDAFQVPDRWGGREIPTARFVEAARAKNIAVHVWTVNEVETMHQLFDRGVDAIVTDRPDLLAGVLHARFGRPLPPGPTYPLPEPFLQDILEE